MAINRYSPPQPRVDFEKSNDAENIRTLYAAWASKRVNYDLMLWQAPIISLTAQAFLLQIALGDDKLWPNRFISGLVAALISFASWQLFIRHGAMERQASDKLQVIEKKYLSHERQELMVHHKPSSERSCIADTPSKPIWGVCILLVGFPGLIPLLQYDIAHFLPLIEWLRWSVVHSSLVGIMEMGTSTIAFLFLLIDLLLSFVVVLVAKTTGCRLVADYKENR